MDELVNIANYCDNLLIMHGQHIRKCRATYIREDDIIRFCMEYKGEGKENYTSFMFNIQNYDFLISDTEVQVNKTAITQINRYIDKLIYNHIYDIV